MHEEVDRPGHLPDIDRLSLLVATILLAYALARFIDLPARKLALQLPGIYLAVNIDAQTIVALLVAALTATGVDWLVHSHPGLGKYSAFEHWLLPALTAWAIELPLSQMPFSPLWWVGFTLGGILLTLVLVAEYIVIDPDDVRQPPAAAGLTVLSFALYLVLAAALRFAGLRLFLLLPSLALAGSLVSLRALHLRLHGQWAILPAIAISLITVQMAAALHYWPVSPVSFGLVLLGPAYALTRLSGNLTEGEPIRQAILEPGLVLFFIWGIAFWIR
jgi:hypothetical protein